jgi:hypothetical protein
MSTVAALLSYKPPYCLQRGCPHVSLAWLSYWFEVIRGSVSRCGTVAHAEKNKFDGRIAKCPPFAARMEFPS